MRFKVGNKVKVKKDCSGCVIDTIYTLRINNGRLAAMTISDDLARCTCQHNWILVKTKINIRNLNKKLCNLK